MTIPAGQRLPPVPEGAPERGTLPLVTDESQDAPPPPPPPPAQPEASVPSGNDVIVKDMVNAPPPASGPVPPTEKSEVPEVAAALADPTKITKDSLDAAYRSLARRRSALDAELKRIDAGLVRLRDIAAVTKQKRLDCFGQFDPSAPFCTQTCRDPICPSYTEHTRHARVAAMAPELARVAERMGETVDALGSHEPRDVDRSGSLADGTRVLVD